MSDALRATHLAYADRPQQAADALLHVIETYEDPDDQRVGVLVYVIPAQANDGKDYRVPLAADPNIGDDPNEVRLSDEMAQIFAVFGPVGYNTVNAYRVPKTLPRHPSGSRDPMPDQEGQEARLIYATGLGWL